MIDLLWLPSPTNVTQQNVQEMQQRKQRLLNHYVHAVLYPWICQHCTRRRQGHPRNPTYRRTSADMRYRRRVQSIG